MNYPIQWLEIVTTDLERAKNFYANIFNPEFQFIEMSDSKMYMFGIPDKVGSAGCLVKAEASTPSPKGTIVYFSCADLSNEFAKI